MTLSRQAAGRSIAKRAANENEPKASNDNPRITRRRRMSPALLAACVAAAGYDQNGRYA